MGRIYSVNSINSSGIMEKTIMFNVRYEITVPSTFGENSPADNEFVASCLAHVVSAMNSQFGGCTVVNANGAWNNSDGETISEPVNVVYAYGVDCKESWDCMLDLAAWVKLTMLQSAVLIAKHSAKAILV